MTLHELLGAHILNEGCYFVIYTENDEVYRGNIPSWMDIPAEYANYKVACVTARELKFCIRIKEDK